MDIRKFIDNPYIEEIYSSFKGRHSDEAYAEMVSDCIKRIKGPDDFTVISVEG